MDDTTEMATRVHRSALSARLAEQRRRGTTAAAVPTQRASDAFSAYAQAHQLSLDLRRDRDDVARDDDAA